MKDYCNKFLALSINVMYVWLVSKPSSPLEPIPGKNLVSGNRLVVNLNQFLYRVYFSLLLVKHYSRVGVPNPNSKVHIIFF